MLKRAKSKLYLNKKHFSQRTCQKKVIETGEQAVVMCKICKSAIYSLYMPITAVYFLNA